MVAMPSPASSSAASGTPSHGPGIPTRQASSSVTGACMEVYGEGAPTVLLMPTWSIVHSRHWKCRSPTSPGTVASSRSRARSTARTGRRTPEAYRERNTRPDAIAVLDATGHGARGPRVLSTGPERPRLADRYCSPRVIGGASREVFDPPALRSASGRARQGSRTSSRTTGDGRRLGRIERRVSGGASSRRSSSSWFVAWRRCSPSSHSTKPIEAALGWKLDRRRDGPSSPSNPGRSLAAGGVGPA